METRIGLPRPPAEPEPASFPLLASLAPVLGAGGLWLLLQTPTVLVFALLGPVIALASLGDGRRVRRRRRRRETERWRVEIAHVAARIDAALDQRREAMAAAHPGAREIAGRAAHDPHRWRRSAGDAVPIVLGIGALPSGVAVEGEVPATDELARSVGAAAEAERLRSFAAVVHGPVVVDARDGLGIVGQRRVALAAARAAVVQVLDAVPPDAAEVIAPDDPAWDWLTAAPHPLHREPGSAVRVVGDGLEATVAIAARASALPRECRVVMHVALDSARLGSRALEPAALAEREAADAALTLALAAEHAGIRRAGVVPAHVDLEALPVATGGLAATFLVADGPIELDLVREGPHAVVGGTTGSGKSELLLAWIAAMATGRSTAEVSFLLVDFKGGASFGPLAGLAHCVGVMTDLDDVGARRAIESLRAELRRRERVLADQGARAVEQASGLPRLVIVVDEFAAMLQELPDLHRLFVDLAARGRSLGVHLVLCTQRPSEAVRDALLANCGIRISLRVTDEHDAVAITGTAEAATIPLAARGRCVVRVSGGATRAAQAAIASPAHLAALVAHAAGQPGPPRPWCAPLPARLPLALVQADTVDGVRLGLVDLPAQQRVAPLVWRPGVDGPLLAIGGTSSGRSSLADLLAGQLGCEVVDREDALWDALHPEEHAGGALVVDDVDLQLSRLGEEQQSRVCQLLAGRMRDGSAVALTARRVPSSMGQIAPLAELRILLRIASRQEHVVAGGAGHLHDGSLLPGAGWLRDERIQLALPDARAPRRAPRSVPMPTGPAAIVLGAGVAAPRLAHAARPGERSSLGDADVVVGTVAEWEAAWGELDRLRADRPVVVLGVDERQLRQVLRLAPPVPPMRSAPAWVLERGRFERLRYLSSEATGTG
ncbi:FtsK/SpoIIIE domain-containing protein [Agrococcus sp. DT81.2]|uniref:FtsK/SpoIIIE domain-containing protein n=1 Tax=Agrococcus sp. DT81.2 TaxID=3393414 RepID=UPI003CE515FD